MAAGAAQARRMEVMSDGRIVWGHQEQRAGGETRMFVRANYLSNLARQQGTNGGRSLDDESMGEVLVHVQSSSLGRPICFDEAEEVDGARAGGQGPKVPASRRV